MRQHHIMVLDDGRIEYWIDLPSKERYKVVNKSITEATDVLDQMGVEVELDVLNAMLDKGEVKHETDR